MDDPRILRVITVGLILAVLAVVYFLFTGGFSLSKAKINQANKEIQPSASSVASPSAVPSVLGQQTTQPSPTPVSAYNTIARRNLQATEVLPATGFLVNLSLVFSFSAIASGLALRKFSK